VFFFKFFSWYERGEAKAMEGNWDGREYMGGYSFSPT
jgi:hypothetical protein